MGTFLLRGALVLSLGVNNIPNNNKPCFAKGIPSQKISTRNETIAQFLVLISFLIVVVN